MKPVRKLSSYVLLVGVMGLSIVGGVVAYQIYSASIKSQTTTAQSTAIKPLDGAINQATVDNLKRRTVYNDTQMGLLIDATPTQEATSGALLGTPIPLMTPAPVAPEATSGATTL